MDSLKSFSAVLETLDLKALEDCDERSQFPSWFFDKLHDAGLMGCTIASRGDGLPMERLLELARSFGYHLPSGLFLSWLGNALAVSAIDQFAGDSVRRSALDAYRARKQLMSFCFTEPGAGTDIGLLSTEYARSADGFVITGEKTFITNASYASHFVVFARERSTSKRVISVFYVPGELAGIRRGQVLGKLGNRSSNTAKVAFDGVVIPEENLLGALGEGGRILGRCISRTKTLMAGTCVGICQRAQDVACGSLGKRNLYGGPLLERAEIRAELARQHVNIEASWLLALKAARAWDEGNAIREASMAKYFAAATAVETVSRAMEYCGGYGYLDENPLSRMYRDAKAYEICEGATLVQLALIAREAFDVPKKHASGKAA